MLDDADIQKLIKAFATRDEVATKVDMTALSYKINRLKDRVYKIAAKLEMTLDY